MPFFKSTIAAPPSPAVMLFCLLATGSLLVAGAQTRTLAPSPPVAPADSATPRVMPVPAARTGALNHARPRAAEATAGRTLRLAPQGRWWDDHLYSRNLVIDPRQQRRMDGVFGANRDQLLKLYTNLKHEQAELDKLGKNASETELDRQIDKVAQARTELQKADTHMLLEIRKQLTAEQLAKLDAAQ